MEHRISERIYDLYKLREDPLENFDKIEPILEELGRFGIEYPELARLLDYRSSVRRISMPLQSFELLKKCVNRFLSEEELLEIEEVREFRNTAENLYSKIQTSIQNLREQYDFLRFRITKENQQYFEDIFQKLLGWRLEVELIPNLLEKMGFEKNSTTFKIDDGIVEVDGRYELERFSGARKDRLVSKDVVVVECKTTIDLSEIKKFQSKVEMIKTKYVKEKEIWNYDNLGFKAWMVACYGWNEELLKEARDRGIIPFTSTKLEYELKKYKIFDSRIPICPTSEPAS